MFLIGSRSRRSEDDVTQGNAGGTLLVPNQATATRFSFDCRPTPAGLFFAAKWRGGWAGVNAERISVKTPQVLGLRDTEWAVAWTREARTALRGLPARSPLWG